MKKAKRMLMLTVFFAVFCGVFPMIAQAKDLEPCYHCNSTGEFYCTVCNNAGEVVCDGCGGAGGSICTGDSFKGNGCDNGYYVCASCNGDGKKRTGDGEIVEGACGNCNGAGKLRCVVCSTGTTPGWNACSGCEEDGKKECCASNCRDAKAVGWKCPYCKGTKYILVGNPMPPRESNDGVQNLPKPGDLIWVNGKSSTYGGDGDGVLMNTLDGAVPEMDSQSEDNPPQESELSMTETVLDFTNIVPDNRNSNFEIPLSIAENAASLAVATIEIEKMSAEEQQYYAALTDDELDEKLTNVQKILGSVQPRRFEDDAEELIRDIAEKNGYSTLEEGRIMPIYFEGHEELGFPIAVRVHIEKGVLSGGTDLFIYHIREDKAIEFLGKADYITYDDGSVESILFYTTGFSSFFTSAKELDTVIPVASDNGENVKEAENTIESITESTIENITENNMENENSDVTLIVVVVVIFAVASAGVILSVARKRGSVALVTKIPA